MKLKRLIPEPAVVNIVLAIVVSYYLFGGNFTGQVAEPIETVPGAYLQNLESENSKQPVLDRTIDVSAQLAKIDIENEVLEQQISRLLFIGDNKQSTTMLLEVAALAIAQDDKDKLGKIMLLLGKVATNAQELDAAEVYLQEALDIALQTGNKMAVAGAYQQFGHLHIRSRELARESATAYDQLWLARNHMFRGQYREANTGLQKVIADNLAIRRYGAAASAYETLSEFHQLFHDKYMAQDAAMEAARLYASSGYIMRSREILETLQTNGLDNLQIESIQDEVDALFRQHQNDVAQTARARDYQMLYRHYKARGDLERAWKLRILASKSLAKTSERSMYARQPDVLAILYNSNFAMNKAKNYLDQASNLFSGEGEAVLSASTQNMHSLIY